MEGVIPFHHLLLKFSFFYINFNNVILRDNLFLYITLMKVNNIDYFN